MSINNERGINSIGKRQQLAKSWKNKKIDIAVMGETLKNSGGMEAGISWGNEYVAFFSTGIKPKEREEEEKKRIAQWDIGRRKRSKKGKISPQPMAKARNPREKKERLLIKGKGEGKGGLGGPGKGKGKGPSRTDKDFEHAGVGIAINKKWLNNVVQVKEISGRLMTIKLDTATGGITIFSVYAPTASRPLNEKEAFYDSLTKEINETDGILYIG
jgi:hypothetical protein